MSNVSSNVYLGSVKECDLRSIGHIARVMLNRSEKDLNQYEIAALVREYYTLIGMRNKGLIKLPVT